MKKFLFALFLMVLCPSLLPAGEQAPADDLRKKVSSQAWSIYSYGVYYKNLAAGQSAGAEKDANLRKAIKYLNDAAAAGIAMDRVYNQLSECYTYSGDFTAAIEYAKKSLALDSRNFTPYQRLYVIYNMLRNYPMAAAALEDYMKQYPDAIAVRFTLGQHYYTKMKDLDKSEAAFQDVIAISRRISAEDYYRENAFFNLGYIYYAKGDLDRSVSSFEETFLINRDNMHAVFLLALLCMERYNLKSAEKYARLYLERVPQNDKMMLILGRIKYLRGDPEALGLLRFFFNQNTTDALLAMGLYYEMTGNDEAALPMVYAAAKSNPEEICGRLALARILLRKNDRDAAFNEFLAAGLLFFKYRLYDQARVCFRQAADLNDKVAGVYYYLGRIYEERNSQMLAIVYYKEANRLQPDIEMLLHIGYLHALKKDYASATSIFDSVLAKEPKNSKAHFFKGLVMLWKEDYGTAEVEIRKAISLYDKSETYYFYLAVVMEKMKRLDEAIASLEKAIKADPKSARSYNYLGYLYADNNIKIDESHKLIQKALSFEPRNGAYIDSLGWVYYRMGRLQQALEKLLEAEKILGEAKTPDPVVYDHIGDTYEKLGMKREAVDYWNKSLKIEKNEKIQKKVKEHSGD